MNKILVIGTGSIATRHVNNILYLKPNISIDVFSSNFSRAKKLCQEIVSNKKNIRPVKYKDIINKTYSHVIIASKTIYHNRYLKIFFKKKSKIYCEKPLPLDKIFFSLGNIKNEKKVTIGFQFRFNPAIEYIKKQIKKEKLYNPRLQVKNRNEYVNIMNNLNLPTPKLMDIAIPINKLGGKNYF